MKTIIFIRHAKSSWSNPEFKDIDRPLNSRGLRDAPFMSQKLKERNIMPDLFVSSPARRAHTTAQIFAKTLGYELDNIILESQIYEATPDTIFKIIKRFPNDKQTVLLFGHNPTMTFLANTFSEAITDNLPTCGLFAVEFDIKKWEDFKRTKSRLTFLDFPKNYR